VSTSRQGQAPLQTMQTASRPISNFQTSTFKAAAGSHTRLLCMSRTSGSPLWAPKLPRHRTASRLSQLDQWSRARNMGQSPSQEAQTASGADGEPERRLLGTDFDLSLAYISQLLLFTTRSKKWPANHPPIQQMRVLRKMLHSARKRT
jgi:hypothetical protein